MLLLDELAERRIREAMERGEFDALPGSGRPLVLEDDALVPEELRVGYRLLKNAGFMPPALALRREIASVEELLAAATGEAERGELDRRLQCLNLRLAASRGCRIDPVAEERYRQRLRARLER